MKELLEKDGSVSIHDRNIHCLAVEMYKVSNWLFLPLISDIFKHKNSHPYNVCLILSFLDLLLKLYLMELIAYVILVQ